jgi:hypothetical protein
MIVNDELETIWKEALWSNFKLQFQNSPGETEENLKILSQDSREP